jgi:hypothetical protein
MASHQDTIRQLVVGCTAKRAAREDIPTNSISRSQWLSLVALPFGVIMFREPPRRGREATRGPYRATTHKRPPRFTGQPIQKTYLIDTGLLGSSGMRLCFAVRAGSNHYKAGKPTQRWGMRHAVVPDM